MHLETGGPDLPLLVFTFVSIEQGIGRSLFLKVRENYKDMLEALATKATSGAGGSLRLFVANLAVCGGREIEVDEDAWDILAVQGKGAFSEVVVRMDAPLQHQEQQIMRAEKGKGRGEEDKENRKPLSVKAVSPETSNPKPIPQATPVKNATSRIAALYRSPSPRSTRGNAPPHVTDLFASDEHIAEDYSQRASPPRHDENSDSEDVAGREEEGGQSSQGTGRSWEDVGYDNENENDNDNDSEREEEREEKKAYKSKFRPTITKAATTTQPPKETVKKEAEFDDESTLASPMKKGQSSGAAPPVIEQDDRFKVTIFGPDRDRQRATLMTKGKHPARKVLNAVCKSFGITGRAQLNLLVASDDDMEDSFPLEPDETMAQNGVSEGARLLIKLVEDDDTEDATDYDE